MSSIRASVPCAVDCCSRAHRGRLIHSTSAQSQRLDIAGSADYSQFHVDFHHGLANLWQSQMISANPARRPRFPQRIDKNLAMPEVEKPTPTTVVSDYSIIVGPWPPSPTDLWHALLCIDNRPIIDVICLEPESLPLAWWLLRFFADSPFSIRDGGGKTELATPAAERIICNDGHKCWCERAGR